MEPRQLWEHLRRAAEDLGVEVRLENLAADEDLGVKSGLCRLGDRRVAFVDRRLGPAGRCRGLAHCLLQLDLDSLYLKPAIREYLEQIAGD